MINDAASKRKYDLGERTAQFAERLIRLVRQIKADSINREIISQLVSSAGSIGANYSEATEAESRKDFIHKISIAKKEAKETQHWMRLLSQANPELRSALLLEWKESQELLKIFSKSITTSRSNLKN